MAGECPELSELHASASKQYRLELGSGDRAKEVFERWQRLRQKESNIRLLHKALDLLEKVIVPSACKCIVLVKGVEIVGSVGNSRIG